MHIIKSVKKYRKTPQTCPELSKSKIFYVDLAPETSCKSIVTALITVKKKKVTFWFIKWSYGGFSRNYSASSRDQIFGKKIRTWTVSGNVCGVFRYSFDLFISTVI